MAIALVLVDDISTKLNSVPKTKRDFAVLQWVSHREWLQSILSPFEDGIIIIISKTVGSISVH